MINAAVVHWRLCCCPQGGHFVDGSSSFDLLGVLLEMGLPRLLSRLLQITKAGGLVGIGLKQSCFALTVEPGCGFIDR